MIKVDQSIISAEDGDCFRAVIASVLDLTLEQVPHFLRFKSDWNIMFFRFMKMFNWSYAGNVAIDSDVWLNRNYSIDGYFICSVPSATFKESSHAVLVDESGIVVHDPNPNKLWEGVNLNDIPEEKGRRKIYHDAFEPYNRAENELW